MTHKRLRARNVRHQRRGKTRLKGLNPRGFMWKRKQNETKQNLVLTWLYLTKETFNHFLHVCHGVSNSTKASQELYHMEKHQRSHTHEKKRPIQMCRSKKHKTLTSYSNHMHRSSRGDHSNHKRTNPNSSQSVLWVFKNLSLFFYNF